MICILIISCVVSLIELVGTERTVTLTESRTITSTLLVNSNFVCAKPVDVTGKCRQRRGLPFEEPLILIMDEPFFDLPFYPTKMSSIEVTPLTILPDRLMDSLPVESSMQRLSGRNNNQGFFSKFFYAFFNSIVSTISVTLTNVFTHTLSRTIINTKSFTIMGCTPSPLLYTICPTDGVSSANEESEILFHLWHRYKWRPFVTHSIVTRRSTVTAVVVSSTVGLCAQLVNVTGPCRLRRGMWVDDPIVLSFDGEMDSIDEAFSPSETLRIEPTVMPELMARSILSNSMIQSSSMSSPEELDEELSQRLGFLNIAAFQSALRNRIKFVTLRATTLVTVTRTSTYYVTISTKTFFVQVCTPTPFPYNVCSAGRIN